MSSMPNNLGPAVPASSFPKAVPEMPEPDFTTFMQSVGDAIGLALSGAANMNPERRARIVARIRGISRESWGSAVERETERFSRHLADAEDALGERAVRTILRVEHDREVNALRRASDKAARLVADRERKTIRQFTK